MRRPHPSAALPLPPSPNGRGKSSAAAKGEGDEVDRPALEARWLHLTRETLPALAASRNWPVHADHCFQRILLDNACGGRWYDHVAGRPAYRHIADDALQGAIALGETVIAGDADLYELNRKSLAWRNV